MKILPIILTCLALSSPASAESFGNLIEKDTVSSVRICSEGKLCKENIEIVVSSGEDKVIVEPNANIGYNPQIFVGNFLGNSLDEVLYSIDGDDNTHFYQVFSFSGGKAKSLFDSDDFEPTIEAKYIDNNAIEIYFQGKRLLLNNTSSENCNHDDCSLHVTKPLSILPYFSVVQNKYFLQVEQSVYGGYEANCFGYLTSLIEIKEDGFGVLSVGTSSNIIY